DLSWELVLWRTPVIQHECARASSLGDMANSLSINVHRENDCPTTVGVQEYAIHVAVSGNTPECWHPVDVHLGVGDTFGLLGCQMQALIDVPNRCQIQIRT